MGLDLGPGQYGWIITGGGDQNVGRNGVQFTTPPDGKLTKMNKARTLTVFDSVYKILPCKIVATTPPEGEKNEEVSIVHACRYHGRVYGRLRANTSGT